jgi:hypothetical protein
LYPGRPLQPEAGFAGSLWNIDLDAEDSPLSPVGLHHLNITTSAAVQACGLSAE